MTTRRPSKRHDIVAGALRLFAARGIKATTIRDIAAAAGVTEGALYRHFDSKSELARSLFSECAAMLYTHLQEAVEGVTGAMTRLSALARAFFDFAATRPEAYEYVMARHHDNVGGLPPGQPLPKEFFVQAVREGIAAAELRAMDPELGAAMIIGMCIHTIFFLDQGMIEVNREQAVSEICQALHRVFQVGESHGRP